MREVEVLAARGGRAVRRRWIAAVALCGALIVGPVAGADAASTRPEPAPTAGGCSVAAGTWPEYQGDPTHAANACSTLTRSSVTTLRPAWFVATRGAVTGTPVVAFGSVFAGDYSGQVHAVDRRTGGEQWTFDTTAGQDCFLDAAAPHADTHQTGFGQIPASPAAASIATRRMVFVAAGGSLFALDARTGRCLWAQDTDPGAPGNAVEIESSPVIDLALTPPEVLVGNDDNSSPGVGVTGLMAFDAANGALLWKYEPERDLTLTPGEFGGSNALTLSCGDGSPDPYCTPGHIPGLAPNDKAHADACGDVWSSPALDPAFADPAGENSYQGSGTSPPPGWQPKQITSTGTANPAERPDGLVVFGTGNCAAHPDPAAALGHGDYVDNQGVFALDPVTGIRVWDFVEPYNRYDNNPNEPGGGDDDFGSSAIVAHLPASSVPARACPADSPRGGRTTTTLIIEGSKAGFAYGLCAADGRDVWAVQAAQPGQLSADLVGAVGGFIGSPSLGTSHGRPTVFFTSAIALPLANDGVREPGDGDSNITACPGMAPAPILPACPDLGSTGTPRRQVSLHALDAATGRIVYQAPSLPTYAASSYTNGVVFVPDSLAGSVAAFDADTGTPIWAFPLAAVPASGTAIAGNSIYLGTGETDSSVSGESVPPQLTGIWSFSPDAGEAIVGPPGAP